MLDTIPNTEQIYQTIENQKETKQKIENRKEPHEPLRKDKIRKVLTGQTWNCNRAGCYGWEIQKLPK